MADQEALRQLIERWRELVLRYEQACREANRDGNVELDAYRDGKAMGVKDCMYELEAVLASPGSENGPLMRSIASGLQAIDSFMDGHLNTCNGGEDGPCDCGYIRPRDVIDALLKQIAASPGSVSDQGWRDISSAPKNGLTVLLTAENNVVLCAFYQDGRWQHDGTGNTVYGPKYWMPMPLPAPPVSPAQPDQGKAKS